MNHSFILWICLFAYAMHILEEFLLDWKGWATRFLKLEAHWDHFAVANIFVIVWGTSCASVGWACTLFALTFPALMILNATFFHLLPFIRKKGLFSPGLLTSVFLFYPMGFWAYFGAWQDGQLSMLTLVLSLLLGAAFMGFPLVMLKLRSYPYFNQNRD
jgi:hypothetical protein